MPYLVPVQVRDSPIQGKGVFALEDIPKGTICWAMESENFVPIVGYVPQPNMVLKKEQLEKLPVDELKAALFGGFSDPQNDCFTYLRDGCQFTNHSSNPNCVGVSDNYEDHTAYKCKTTRGIKKGEELTENYIRFLSLQPEWLVDMLAKFCPEKLEFQRRLVKEFEESS